MTLTPAATQSPATATEYAEAAARAVAGVLPAAQPLTASAPQPGSPHVTSAFAGAALAELDGPVTGQLAVLVAGDLVQALAGSPLGGLDLAAAVQPALDAAAAVLGGTARAGSVVELDSVVALLGGPFLSVPLVGAGIAAAVLLPETTLDAALRNQAAATAPMTATAPSAPATPAPGADAMAPAVTGTATHRGIEMLHGVVMDVTVEIGRTRMSVRDLLALAPGTVLELDRAAGSPADLLVNGRLIARGEVVVVDEDFGLRVTEIVDDSTAV